MSVSQEAKIPPNYFASRRAAHIIRTEAEALAIADKFAGKIAQGAAERDRNWVKPFDEISELAESGLFGITVPREYGGLGVSAVTLVEIFKRISIADSAIGQIPRNHHQFVLAVDLSGSVEQKKLYFGQVLDGQQFGNALSERGTRGALDLRTRVKAANGDGFILNGQKHYSTGALFAPTIPVFALDEEDRLVVAHVPHEAKGVTILDDWAGNGQRGTASGTVIFENVELAPINLFPHWQIYQKPRVFGAFGQIMHVAIDTGIAQGALEDAGRFVRERSRIWFESGIDHVYNEPHIIRRFGDFAVKLGAAEALLEKAARSYDEALVRPLTEESANRVSLAVATAKVAATDAAIEIANGLFEVAGTASMDAKYNLDRHWRNARIHTLNDPVRWKLHHIGNYVLNGKLLPNNPIN